MPSWPVNMKFLWMLDLRNTSVFSLTESKAALKAAKTCPLVRQCQKALNDISILHSVGLFGSLDTLGYEEMKLPTSSQERELFANLLDLNGHGVSRQNLRKKITLDGQPAYGKVAGAYHYPETGWT
jgi:hypothetical protein